MHVIESLLILIQGRNGSAQHRRNVRDFERRSAADAQRIAELNAQ